MENKAFPAKISYLQLAAILAVSVLFTITAVSHNAFGSGISNASFISLPVGAGFLFILYAPLAVFAALNVDNALSRVNRVFKWLFGTVILLRLLCVALITVSQLRVFVTKTIMPYTPSIVFIAVVLLAAMYGANKGIQATARAAPISLFIILFVIVAVSVLIRDRIDAVRVYSPLGGGGWLSAAFAEAAGNDEIFFFAVLSGFVREKVKNTDGNSAAEIRPQGFKSVIFYLPAVLCVGLWLNFLFISVLGRSLSFTPYPMHKVATFSTLNFVERMDGVLATAAIFSGLLKITVAFICIREVIYELSGSNKKPTDSANPDKAQNTERAAKIITSVLVAATAVAAYFIVGREETFILGKPAGIYYIASLGAVTLLLPAAAFISKRKSDKGKAETAAGKDN